MAELNKQLLFGGFERLQDFPLDESSIFKTLDELKEYVENNRIAYAGQILVVLTGKEDRGVYYIIENDDSTLGYLKVASIETDKKVKILEEAVKEIQDNYASKTDLTNLKNEILGSEDLDKSLDTVKEIQDWITEHGKDFDELIKHLSNDYVKKAELDDILSSIEGVEKTLSARFDKNESGIIEIPAGYVLNEIKVIIKSSDSIANTNFKGIKIKSVVSGDSDPWILEGPEKIDFTEAVDSDGEVSITHSKPNIYIFTECYSTNEYAHELFLDIENGGFGEASGLLIAKISKD